MKTITDNTISIEEALMALECMQKSSLSAHEALETVDEYVERVRAVSMAYLANYIIDKRLSDIQRSVIRGVCFEDKSVAQCAEELCVSQRAVYAAKTKAMQILKAYLEPLVMYFTNLPQQGEEAGLLNQSLEIIKSVKSTNKQINNAVENIRLAHAVTADKLACALGLDEGALIKKEKGKQPFTITDIQKYSSIFNIKITINFEKGDISLIWKNHSRI